MSQPHATLIARIKQMPLHSLVGQHVRLKPAGHGKFKGLCPFHGEKTPSFNVDDNKGSFICWGCGARGDAIDFAKELFRMEFEDALREVAAFFGLRELDAPLRVGRSQPDVRPVEKVDDAARVAREIATGRKLWLSAKNANGTLVAAYLTARAIDIKALPMGVLPPTIRFEPAMDYWYAGEDKPRLIGKFPAMVAAIQSIHGRIIGAHITYLDAAGGGKLKLHDPMNPGKFLASKKIRGTAYGGGIRLAPLGHHMMTAEGIENSLTAMAYHPHQLGAWAAISLQNLAGGGMAAGERLPHPEREGQFLPTTLPCPNSRGFQFSSAPEEVTIIRDNDSKDWATGNHLFIRAARKFRSLGTMHIREVVPPRGEDLNSSVMKVAR